MVIGYITVLTKDLHKEFIPFGFERVKPIYLRAFTSYFLQLIPRYSFEYLINLLKSDQKHGLNIIPALAKFPEIKQFRVLDIKTIISMPEPLERINLLTKYYSLLKNKGLENGELINLLKHPRGTRIIHTLIKDWDPTILSKAEILKLFDANKTTALSQKRPITGLKDSSANKDLVTNQETPSKKPKQDKTKKKSEIIILSDERNENLIFFIHNY